MKAENQGNRTNKGVCECVKVEIIKTPKHSLIAAGSQLIMNDTVVAGLVSGDPDEDDDEDFDDGED